MNKEQIEEFNRLWLKIWDKTGLDKKELEEFCNTLITIK